MKKNKFLLFMVLSLFVLVLAACGGDEDESTDSTTDTSTDGEDTATETPDYGVDLMSVLTGGTQGTYYALGGTFADLISTETGIKTTAEVSQASAANMTALKEWRRLK